jgi:hypothetical protein
MRFLFWNIRGFGRPVRRRHIKYIITEEGLDGVDPQETIREEFSQKELQALTGASNFRWAWKGAKGHSGGMLMGVNEDRSEVEEIDMVEYFMSMVLRNRLTNLRWELITVYGPAQHSQSTDFIVELFRKCMRVSLPVVLGGNFNLIRFASDKNNDNINQPLMDKFNMFIDLHQL